MQQIYNDYTLRDELGDAKSKIATHKVVINWLKNDKGNAGGFVHLRYTLATTPSASYLSPPLFTTGCLFSPLPILTTHFFSPPRTLPSPFSQREYRRVQIPRLPPGRCSLIRGLFALFHLL
jgi:hypothetical protein